MFDDLKIFLNLHIHWQRKLISPWCSGGIWGMIGIERICGPTGRGGSPQFWGKIARSILQFRRLAGVVKALANGRLLDVMSDALVSFASSRCTNDDHDNIVYKHSFCLWFMKWIALLPGIRINGIERLLLALSWISVHYCHTGCKCIDTMTNWTRSLKEASRTRSHSTERPRKTTYASSCRAQTQASGCLQFWEKGGRQFHEELQWNT